MDRRTTRLLVGVVLGGILSFSGLGIGSVAAQDYAFVAPDHTINFNPDTGALLSGDFVSAGQIVVPVDIIEDPDSMLYPSDAQGFSMSFESDSTYLTPVSAELVGTITTLNEDEGPDFVTLAVADNDEGFIVGIVNSLGEDVTLVLEETVLEFTYDLNTANLIDEVDPITTTMFFSDNLVVAPQPPTASVVVVGGESLVPTFDDADVTLNPLVGVPFRRGDADGNGLVFAILDALFLLEFGFTGGPAPVCDDAADADDNGQVFAILDALFLLEFGFTGGAFPPDPGTDICGPDPTDDAIDCAEPTGGC